MRPLSQHYGVILADPPWTFATYSRKGKGRSEEAHYDCMSLVDIKALPVGDWTAPDCALFLWATDPSLPQALEVIEAWGFTYKPVAFTWAKTTKDGAGFPIGCGYWTRANPEQCLLATRGRPQRPRPPPGRVRQTLPRPPQYGAADRHELEQVGSIPYLAHRHAI